MARLEVKVVSKKLIKPLNPTPIHLQKSKLSLFDQLAPRVYPGILYYYSGGGPDENTDYQIAKKCTELEKSLSRALDYHYPFAGRFIKEEVSIDCGDQGAEFWHARVSCKLSDFLLRGGPEIELVDKLLPWEIPPSLDSGTSPQLGIQVNCFDDGGIVVGVRISHILADAATTSMLMNTWATICRGNETRVLPVPVSDFESVVADAFPAIIPFPGFNHPLISSILPGNEADNKIVTRRFLISSRFLNRSFHNATADGERKPSRVVITLALVWKALMGASVVKHGHLRDSALSIPMNLRGKLAFLGNKKADKIFGNFYISVIVPFVAKKVNNINDVDLYDLGKLIKNSIADASGKVSRASRDDLQEMLINSRREVVAKWIRNDCEDVYFCSSWYGALPVYETDFGWGKPIWSSICTQPGPGVCLMDSPNDDGIELWVSLKQAEMLPFQRQFYTLASISDL